MVNLAVDDQTPVIRKEFGKPSKRVTDILNILKEVHMVLLNVQDNADVREKAQKGVGVLACLRHEIVGLADTDIAADGQGRVGVCRQQHFRDHGGRGRLAVCAADSDGSLVIFHDLA